MKPALTNPIARMLLALVLFCATFSPLAVRAAEATPENPDTGKPFANVQHLKGEVTVTDKNGESRKLKNGGVVLVGEKVSAASNSEAVLQTGDAGIVAVRPGAEFIPERFSAEGKTTDRQILRLLTGSLRIISGWIGQINSNNHRVLTPSATIGIRGTDHEPYVLPQEKANATYLQGTYDKVNRGATSLEANGGEVGINSGKVGFARDPNSVAIRTRALMTLLLPVLLDRVPDFYVPGAFDKELDRYSATADANARKQLEKLPGRTLPAPALTTAPTTTSQKAVTTTEPLATPIVGCPPVAIGEVWLGRLDRAIANNDIKTILSLFAPEIVAKATVQKGSGTTTLEFSREEMVNSILSSISNLKDYTQRRVSIEATLAEGETSESCKKLRVKSITIEQGLMNGKPFRFESLEDYLLEQRNGEWLAITAHTTQR